MRRSVGSSRPGPSLLAGRWCRAAWFQASGVAGVGAPAAVPARCAAEGGQGLRVVEVRPAGGPLVAVAVAARQEQMVAAAADWSGGLGVAVLAGRLDQLGDAGVS